MNILLVAATKHELEPLFSKGSVEALGPHVHSCRIDGFPVFRVLITGVGTAATVFTVTEYLLKNKCDLAIQVGICGAFDTGLSIGDAVLVEKDRFAQLGAEDDDRFLDVFELGLANKDTYPYTGGWLHGMMDIPAACADLVKVTGITNETTTGSNDTRDKLIAQYHAQIESMEGAGFFFAAAKCNTPALQIRTISNYVEKRNKANWNIPLAVDRLHHTLTHLLPILSV